MQNLNQHPYYDDFDETKDFHQVLFRPGIPVQARELTQLQTILNTQISRFGDHIFSNGSRVKGANATVNASVYSVELDIVNVGSIVAGNYIKGQTSGLVAEVIASYNNVNGKSYLIYIPRGTGTSGSKFEPQEVITPYNDGLLEVVVSASLTTSAETSTTILLSGTKGNNVVKVSSLTNINVGSFIPSLNAYVISFNTTTLELTLSAVLSKTVSLEETIVLTQCSSPTSLYGVSEGVFYANGSFIRVANQSVVPNLKNRWVTCTIGLIYLDEIVTSDDDQTLLDPSQGSYNYTAPGADRLKISLKLISYLDSETKDASFVELLRIENGQLIRQNRYTEYGEIMKTIARRTYDESGNYVVNPFIISLKDVGNTNTINSILSPGKAYVGGYEFETISPYTLPINRALDIETSPNFGIETYLGSYVNVSNLSGTAPISGSTIEFLNSTSTVVGTGVYLQMASVDGVRIYVCNINGNITNATSIRIGSFTATVNGTVIDVNENKLIFDIPQTNIKSVQDISYTTSRVYRNVLFTNGIATISTSSPNERFSGGSGILPTSVADSNYSLFDASGKTIATVDVKTVSAGTNGQCEISVNDNAFNGTGSIIATVDSNVTPYRVKTTTVHTMKLDNVTTTESSLLHSDLWQINSVAVIAATETVAGEWSATTTFVKDNVVSYNKKLYKNTIITSVNKVPGTDPSWTELEDISSSFTANNGQKDLWYDHATIKSNSATYPKIAVTFEYFKHSGVGPIVVNSYPVEYDLIPSYTTSNNKVYNLRDSIDMRPRRTDDSTSLTFDSIEFADDNGVESSVTYYLSRIDKIVLTNDRTFKVLQGVSSYNAPLPPADISDAMTLATVILPPYTADVSKIKLIMVNNRRYTMQDIGKIEKRVSNVEYYTSLNSLESKVINSNQFAPNGTELFKSGFVTDSFDNFNVGNVYSPNYKCSIDTVKGICRPRFKLNNIAMKVNSALSGITVNNGIITLPYTLTDFASVNKATSYTNINPFNVLSNIGVASIVPSSDYWYDTVTLPQINNVNEDTSAFAIAQQQAANENLNSQWSSWTTSWTGTPLVSTIGYTSSTTATDITQERFKIQQVVKENSIVQSDNTVVISRDTQPYARENSLRFTVDGLTPYSNVYVWIDKTMVNGYVTPDVAINENKLQSISVTTGGSGYTTANVSVSGTGTGATAFATITDGVITGITVSNVGENYTSDPIVTITGDGTGATATASITKPQRGMPIKTDDKGHCSGTLEFPNNDSLRFICGKHRIIFSDSLNRYISNSYADIVYTAEGYINTTQRSVSSTRVPQIITETIYDYTTKSDVTTRDDTPAPSYTPSYSDFSGSSSGSSQTYFAMTDSGVGLSADQTFNAIWSDPTYGAMLQQVPYSQLVEVVNSIISGYASVLSDNPDRTVGASTGLAEVSGIAYHAANLVSNSWSGQSITDIISISAQGSGESDSIYRCNNGVDPLAQSFVVSAETLPSGCFIKEIDVFFASKDPMMPVIFELRPMVNGYPSSNTIIPLSTVVKYPENIQTSEDCSLGTTFAFDAPVYLTPGEYAFVLKSGSNQYNVFVSEMNMPEIGTGNVVSKQPYAGSLFESQNASAWAADQSKDACFNIRICQFDTTSSKLLVIDNDVTDVNCDLINVMSQQIQPANTIITSSISLPNMTGNIPVNKDIELPSKTNINAAGTARLSIIMSSNDRNISPIIDMERVSIIAVENEINNKTDLVVAETNPIGDALAKYPTNTVTLNDGFNATSVVVYLNANRPSGSSIEVYARMKNEYDITSLKDHSWVLLTQEVSGGNTSQLDRFVEDKWSIYNYTYNGFTDFNQFEIKVVMYSDNSSKVPVLADVRAIALS